MNAGRFYIDGRDAYEEYRVFLSDGSVASLLAYPSLKKADSTDWPEEDGEETDLTTPRLDTRNVTLKFVSHYAGLHFGEFGSFVAELSDMAYHDFRFPALGDRTFRLRLTTHSALEHMKRADVFTLQFADDFPPCCGTEEDGVIVKPYERTEPESTVACRNDYEMDGRPLTYYGVNVLEGSLAEVMKSPAVKQNLLVKGAMLNGVAYDGGMVRFKSKEVKLKCVMRAAAFGEFWKDYEAFLYDLARPDGELEYANGNPKQHGERRLYVDAVGEQYPCYYKSCSSEDFAMMPGKIWWKFTLTLVFTSFRVGADEYYLAAEDGTFIITESGEEFIDMGVDKSRNG